MGYRPIGEIFIIEDQPLLRVQVTTDAGKPEVILATANHPFFVPDIGWVGAGFLAVGQPLQLASGHGAVVSALESLPGTHPVYNFEVEGFHTYYVGEQGVWVHNVPCGGTEPIPRPVEPGSVPKKPTAEELKNTPGVATASTSLPRAAGKWLDPSVRIGIHCCIAQGHG